jgi:hypothetical protein
MTRIIAEYTHEGTDLGKVVQNTNEVRRFIPALSEIETADFVQGLDPYVRLHMKIEAYGVFRLLQHYGATPTDYVSNEDVLMRVTELGCQNVSQIHRRDNAAYRLIKAREDLETEVKKLFKGETPDNEELDCDIPEEY